MRGLVSELYEGARQYQLSVGLTPLLVAPPTGSRSRLGVWLTNLSGSPLYGGFSPSVSSSNHDFIIPASSSPVQLVGFSHLVQVYVVAGAAGPFDLRVTEFF